MIYLTNREPNVVVGARKRRPNPVMAISVELGQRYAARRAREREGSATDGVAFLLTAVPRTAGASAIVAPMSGGRRRVRVSLSGWDHAGAILQ